MAQNGSGYSRSWHNFSNAFRLAMDSIRAHKLRSFLTLLGVIIGVASVIMVGAAIEGLSVYAEQSTAKAFGSESFLVAQIAPPAALSAAIFDKLGATPRSGTRCALRESPGDRCSTFTASTSPT
jgi:putative ABC transport system permease protein